MPLNFGFGARSKTNRNKMHILNNKKCSCSVAFTCFKYCESQRDSASQCCTKQAINTLNDKDDDAFMLHTTKTEPKKKKKEKNEMEEAMSFLPGIYHHTIYF